MPPNADSSASSTTSTVLDSNLDNHQNVYYSYDSINNNNNNDDVHQSSMLKCRQSSSTEHQMLNKLVQKAGNVENKMMNILHNAWNVKHFNHLPTWLQDNDYILFGYRPPLASFKACFWSIFRLHTETMNIWTHAIGCICFVIISIYLFVASSYANVPFIDKFMLGIFLTTAITCLAFSTCYHTLACHSQQVLNFVCKLDYCGISLLIAGSIVPCLYYAFYCSFFAQICYSFLTLALCAASVTVSFMEKFSDVRYRSLRATVFIAFGFSSFIPTVHWFWIHHDQDGLINSFKTAIFFLTSQALLYLAGAMVYVLRIPECFYPGKFDFYFHSHQLFHILVIMAAICHLRSITSMADVRLFEQQSTCHV